MAAISLQKRWHRQLGRAAYGFVEAMVDEGLLLLASTTQKVAFGLGVELPNWLAEAPELIIDGPDSAPAIILLGSGSSEPVTSRFMSVLAHGLAQRGWQTVRFDFPYLKQRRLRPRSGMRRFPEDPLEVRKAEFYRHLQAISTDKPLIIGGKSNASLIASQIADQAHVTACISFGYPFYSPWKPDEDQAYRVNHLTNLQTPMLIIQGERDEYGGPDDIKKYDLSPQIEVQWIPDRDHRFRSWRSPQETEAECLQEALEIADYFLNQLLAKQVISQSQPTPKTPIASK